MLLLPYIGIVLQYTFQQGQPPILPSVYNMEAVPPVKVWSPVNRSSVGIPAWLNLKCMTTLYNYIKRGLKQVSNKKVRPWEIPERDFVPKRVLPFQPDSRGKWTPNYEGSCAMTFTTVDGDKLTRLMNAGCNPLFSQQCK